MERTQNLKDIIVCNLFEGLNKKLDTIKAEKISDIVVKERGDIVSILLYNRKNTKTVADIYIGFSENEDSYKIVLLAGRYMAGVIDRLFGEHGEVATFLSQDKNADAEVGLFDGERNPCKHTVYHFRH